LLLARAKGPKENCERRKSERTIAHCQVIAPLRVRGGVVATWLGALSPVVI
jgi:hypothetical protein